MYYFLGFELAADHGKRIVYDEYNLEEENKNKRERLERGKNIFLLALDGDVDFLPDAVHKVMDIMKKNKGFRLLKIIKKKLTLLILFESM